MDPSLICLRLWSLVFRVLGQGSGDAALPLPSTALMPSALMPSGLPVENLITAFVVGVYMRWYVRWWHALVWRWVQEK